MRRLIPIAAAILAPAPLFFFFLVTIRYYMNYRVSLVIAAFILAHAFFWPVALVTNWIGRRFEVTAAWRGAPIAGAVSMALFLITSLIDRAINGELASWKGLLMDTAPPGLATAASYFFYGALAASGRVFRNPR